MSESDAARAGAQPDNREAGRWAGAGFFGGFVLAALIGSLVLAVGLGGQVGATTRGGDDVVALVTGERIYSTSCASCHGADGQGGVGLPLGDGVVEAKYPNIAQQIRIIEQGKGAMPAFEGTLSPAEIESVALYEREQLGRDAG